MAVEDAVVGVQRLGQGDDFGQFIQVRAIQDGAERDRYTGGDGTPDVGDALIEGARNEGEGFVTGGACAVERDQKPDEVGRGPQRVWHILGVRSSPIGEHGQRCAWPRMWPTMAGVFG